MSSGNVRDPHAAYQHDLDVIESALQRAPVMCASPAAWVAEQGEPAMDALRRIRMSGETREFTVELILAVRAPDYDAALRIGTEAAKSARRTNVHIRDGRIDNALVSEIRSDDDDA